MDVSCSCVNAYWYEVFELSEEKIEITGPAGRYDSNADIYPEIVPDELVELFDEVLINANWGKRVG